MLDCIWLIILSTVAIEYHDDSQAITFSRNGTEAYRSLVLRLLDESQQNDKPASEPLTLIAPSANDPQVTLARPIWPQQLFSAAVSKVKNACCFHLLRIQRQRRKTLGNRRVDSSSFLMDTSTITSILQETKVDVEKILHAPLTSIAISQPLALSSMNRRLFLVAALKADLAVRNLDHEYVHNADIAAIAAYGISPCEMASSPDDVLVVEYTNRTYSTQMIRTQQEHSYSNKSLVHTSQELGASSSWRSEVGEGEYWQTLCSYTREKVRESGLTPHRLVAIGNRVSDSAFRNVLYYCARLAFPKVFEDGVEVKKTAVAPVFAAAIGAATLAQTPPQKELR